MTKKQIFDEAELIVEDEGDEDQADVTYDIASYPSDLTLSVVYEMWKNNDIVIPEYQRNFVWSIRQASLLIESFLLGLPVPQVFFYVDDQNKSEVIDGQQRIMSLVFFLDGHFGFENIQGKTQVFRLQGLSDSSPFARKRFADLTDPQQRKLKSAVLRAINIRQLNPAGEATSVYHIFERLNTGGTPLKPQEIRNCVFRGNMVKVLRELNANSSWRGILGRRAVDRHQKDIELLLRVFSLAYYLDEYEKPMKQFLNRVMEKERAATSANFKRFVRDFPLVADEIISELGEKPFHIRGPLNSSVLDAVFATRLASGRRFKDFTNNYQRLLESGEFNETTYLSTSDKSVLRRRFDLTRTALLG